MKKIIFSGIAVMVLASFTVQQQATDNESNQKIPFQIQGGKVLSTDLVGTEEPGGGDPDGTGYVELVLNQGQGTITYTLEVENIETATAAHIHIGAPGAAGPPVVHLAAPSTGSSSGVVEVDAELIKAIRKNPGDYYVNVHNATYPAGAVRGQL